MGQHGEAGTGRMKLKTADETAEIMLADAVGGPRGEGRARTLLVIVERRRRHDADGTVYHLSPRQPDSEGEKDSSSPGAWWASSSPRRSRRASRLMIARMDPELHPALGCAVRYAILRGAMTEAIGQHELERMFLCAAARIREQHAALSELDSATGDGDHGTTMLRIVDQLDKTVSPGETAELKNIFHDVGWRVLGVDGGASSSLLGTFFLGMADTPAAGGSLDCRGLAATFEAGLAAVSRRTKARPGDKTMMDALEPAIGALRTAADAGKSVIEALQGASRAARSGAESTSGLTARFGRAKFLGDKTRGHQDPGATSIALLFEGFSSALVKPKGEAGNA